MQEALIGLLGIFLGVLLGEYFRSKNRIEIYSQKIFEKRLEIHEGLFEILQNGYDVALDIMENKSRNYEERRELVGGIVHTIAEYADKNGLYLDRLLAVQVATAFMGAEDVLDIEDEVERESALSKVCENYKRAKDIIADEAGITEVSKHFRSISKSSPDSDVIRYMKELEKNKL